MAIQTWASGACTVTLDDVTGAVTVSGNGAMKDYRSPIEVPWQRSQNLFKTLTIEDGVTSIGAFAFCSCSGFTGSLIIPNSVTNIGNNALASCTGFTGSLIIPNSVTNIGNNAFSSCTGFTGSLIIPNSVTNIGKSAFVSCTGFTGSLIISNRLTRIESYMFENCPGFTGDLTLPESVASIGSASFGSCSGIHRIFNHAKTQDVIYSAFENMGAAALLYGYPENIEFKNEAGDKWRDIQLLPRVATLTYNAIAALYPRTKGAAVYLDNGKTVEETLGGISFWRGTQAEYNALSPKPTNTVYCIIGSNVVVT